MRGLSPEKRAIVPFEEIEKQPKLIEGGQMKDYQARLFRDYFVHSATPNRLSSFMGCLSLLGCTRTVRSSPPRFSLCDVVQV